MPDSGEAERPSQCRRSVDGEVTEGDDLESKSEARLEQRSEQRQQNQIRPTNEKGHRVDCRGPRTLFYVLQIKNIEVGTAISNVNPEIPWHLTLAIYYLCWVRGTLVDTDTQELAYAGFPSGDKWPIQAFGAIAMLAIVAAALLWAEGDIERFAALLLLFTIVDHALWRYLVTYLKSAGDRSQRIYRERDDYFSLEILKVVVRQVQGPWKWFRFGIGLFMVAVICAYAYLASVRASLVAIVASTVQGPSSDELASVIGCGLVFVWIVLMEGWHWPERYRTRVSISLIEELRSMYALQPR
jgi:hypothetical protein